jgi:DNA-binding response OmpR family regulator
MLEMMADILIVEDEILVACDMQDTLEDHGYRCLGIAPDLKTAEQHFNLPMDLALVDLNLRDGLTGPEIGLRLSTAGVPVIFITANPSQIGDGVAGTIGVLTKPTDEATLLAAVRFVLARKLGQPAAPPAAMKLFG